MTEFAQKVYACVRTIPKGSIMTYGQVAHAIGHPKSARAVGSALAKNTHKEIPCHRVIRSDGKIGAYNGLQGKSKLELLRSEGVVL